MVGCKHYNDGHPPIKHLKNTAVLRHLRGTSHETLPPHLVDLSVCRPVGLFYCTAGNCPCPETDQFFTSKLQLHRHEQEHHPTPIALQSTTPRPTSTPPAPTNPSPPNAAICQQLFVNTTPNSLTSWPQGLQFISHKYDHTPPGFRSNWYHFLKGPMRAAFNKLMQDTIDAINLSSKEPCAHQHSS